jgi:hypothetical protein
MRLFSRRERNIRQAVQSWRSCTQKALSKRLTAHRKIPLRIPASETRTLQRAYPCATRVASALKNDA